MAVSPAFRAFVEDVLGPLGPVTTRRMFSGLGVFYRGVMFALVSQEQLFLKVDDDSRGAFEDAGSGPFSYMRGDKPFALNSYYRIPDTLLDDEDELRQWARQAADVALRADAAKPASRRKRQA